MSRPSRIEHFSYLGPYCYFLTLCTYRREPAFRAEEIVHRALLEILRTAADQGFSVLAYCFMPDHLHLLVWGTTQAADFRSFVKVARMRAAYVCVPILGRRLWQEGYHDRVLRESDDERKFARYIVENPVRAGLVRSPIDYPFSGSGVWALEDLVESASRT